MKYPKVKAYVAPEAADGSLFADYLLEQMQEGRVVEFSHIPSSIRTPYIGVLTKMKRQGWRRGLPDYLIITKHNVVFIELKIATGGVLSKEQKIWLAALEKTGKVRVARCNGNFQAEQFMEQIFLEEGLLDKTTTAQL